MKALLLLLFWLWLTPQAWGGGSKKDPPYFSNYNMDFIKNTQTLWGRMVTTCANGKPAFFVWDPLTQYKFHLSCSCGKPLRVHKWHQRIACLLEENCILLMRGYACRHKIKGEEVGCGKIYHSWDITSQLTPKLQRAFPFILFQKSALHKQVLRLVLTGLSKGVSMCATAEQMASLYEGRYNEVVHHAERYFPFSDWGAPPSEFLLIAMIAKEAARGKGFYDACLKSLGAHKLSADHTFKIAKKCTVKVDHHFEKLFDSAYFVLNELGMVLAWRFLEDASIPADILEEIAQRPNICVEEVHSDRCCGEVLVWKQFSRMPICVWTYFTRFNEWSVRYPKRKKDRPLLQKHLACVSVGRETRNLCVPSRVEHKHSMSPNRTMFRNGWHIGRKCLATTSTARCVLR